jgi:AcrR family transcriptional regulator
MMEKQNIKETIKRKAVEIFSEKGFHGTTIREIAKGADCSLPMLYYYYNNKNSLFEEVAFNEFILLIERLNASIIRNESLANIYYQAVRQRMDLNPYDKGVYKLSMKVWLGFDGSKEVRDKLTKWENDRMERTKMILAKACADPEILPVFSNIMVRIIENMIEKIILLDEKISDEEIKKEIDFMMESVKDK